MTGLEVWLTTILVKVYIYIYITILDDFIPQEFLRNSLYMTTSVKTDSIVSVCTHFLICVILY